ncbi:hypothetical protein LTR04_002504 [Oleoguttula sp. CCFEE 6159]|nr:hypothetical protein LTR04_002504 [Oleoguttula sp. CCFEE 6159]
MLLTLLVNTAVIGNYTQPSNGVLVPGILNPNGMYNGTAVNLLPYFNGGLKSTNDGPTPPDCVNFLDGGGAAPLMMNMPANDTTSNQYFLLTHLYQYFGLLLGCSGYNKAGFPPYGGVASQYQVHRYMDLGPYELGYFITQVGLSAASFGVAQADINAAAGALTKTFAYKCSPPSTVAPEQGPQLNSICTDPMCPLDPNATCAAYPSGGTGTPPATCPMTMSSSSTMSSTTSSKMSMTTSVSSSMSMQTCPPASTVYMTKTETISCPSIKGCPSASIVSKKTKSHTMSCSSISKPMMTCSSATAVATATATKTKYCYKKQYEDGWDCE